MCWHDISMNVKPNPGLGILPPPADESAMARSLCTKSRLEVNCLIRSQFLNWGRVVRGALPGVPKAKCSALNVQHQCEWGLDLVVAALPDSGAGGGIMPNFYGTFAQ